jgi:segregation and condensation protein B
MTERTEQERNAATEQIRLERTIEALLFASDAPLSAGKLQSLTGAGSTRDIRSAISSLADFYRAHTRSYEIIEVAGGYQITTLRQFSPIVASLFKSRRKARLSKPALEALAIIAYKQPISRMDVEAIRGVNCEGVLATLTDRDLITITGRGEGVGKPYLYSTTRKFLEYLGLKDYRDLPSMEELEKNLEDIGEVEDIGPQGRARGRPPDDADTDDRDIDTRRENATAEGTRSNGE